MMMRVKMVTPVVVVRRTTDDDDDDDGVSVYLLFVLVCMCYMMLL